MGEGFSLREVNMPGLLDGKIALVTGAGSGIGEATAIASPISFAAATC